MNNLHQIHIDIEGPSGDEIENPGWNMNQIDKAMERTGADAVSGRLGRSFLCDFECPWRKPDVSRKHHTLRTYITRALLYEVLFIR